MIDLAAIKEPHDEAGELIAEVEQLRQEHKDMQGVLDWYANPDNYVPIHPNRSIQKGPATPVTIDHGRHAKETLEKLHHPLYVNLQTRVKYIKPRIYSHKVEFHGPCTSGKTYLVPKGTYGDVEPNCVCHDAEDFGVNKQDNPNMIPEGH